MSRSRLWNGGCAVSGAAGRDVGEHGRAEAPGHDQPVRADGGLRRGPGQAAAAGGALAVRDCAQRFFPRNKHPLQPSPSDDVHSCQHARHPPQLPRRPHHVLSPQGLRELQQQQPCGIHGDFPSSATPTAPPARGLQPSLACSIPLQPAAAEHVDFALTLAALGLARHCLPTSHVRTEGQRDHGGREMRQQGRGNPMWAGPLCSFFPPFFEEEWNLVVTETGSHRQTDRQTHKQIAALHGFEVVFNCPRADQSSSETQGGCAGCWSHRWPLHPGLYRTLSMRGPIPQLS